MTPPSTGSVYGDIGWYLVLLGQYRVVQGQHRALMPVYILKHMTHSQMLGKVEYGLPVPVICFLGFFG